MSWIESHQSLSRHRKTLRATIALGIDRHKLIGHLHELWWWALDNIGSDGDLRDLSDAEIATGAGWTRNAGAFVKALLDVGFIDERDGARFLHDWYQYAGKLMDRREANAERMRDARAKHMPNTCQTRAPATVPTVPTVPTNIPTVRPPTEGVAVPPPKVRISQSKEVTPEYLTQMVREFPTLNVDRIYRLKFARWCKLKQKQETQRRLVDWLEKDARDLQAEQKAIGTRQDGTRNGPELNDTDLEGSGSGELGGALFRDGVLVAYSEGS